jgi:hypothetical protein
MAGLVGRTAGAMAGMAWVGGTMLGAMLSMADAMIGIPGWIIGIIGTMPG